MFSYEKLQDDTIESFTNSVPTMRMRSGDFSELLANGVQIFDPRTARLVNGVVVRDPFPGNIIPADRINPVARNVMGYFPEPNQAPAADLTQNFFAEQPWTYAYNFQMIRVDHEWTAANRTYGRFIRNFRREERFNFAGETQGVEITRGATDRFNFNYARRAHRGALAVHGARHEGELAALQRRSVPALHHRSGEPRVCGVDGGAVRRLPADAELQPRVDIGALQQAASRGSARSRAASTAAARSRSTTSRSRRRSRRPPAPIPGNRIRLAAAAPGRDEPRVAGGAYAFDGTYTRSTNVATSSTARALPSFMLGIPLNASFVETRSNYDARVNSHGAFVHDDWRMSDRLTLNLGIRYDLELGLSEVDNRNIGGFDLTTSNPIEAQAHANFAANPPAGVPIADRRSTSVADTRTLRGTAACMECR